MNAVASIVEGDGEVRALPVLLRRLNVARGPESYVEILRPIRVRRSRFIQQDPEFRRYTALAGAQAGPEGAVMIVMDADDDCPAELGADLLARAREVLGRRRVAVVIANREFEAWFLGAAESLNGKRGLVVDSAPQDPEGPRDAKGWLASRMATGAYGETTDQPAFAARMDLGQAHERCRSFRKLCSEWDHLTKACCVHP